MDSTQLDTMKPWLVAGLAGAVTCCFIYKLTKRMRKTGKPCPPDTVVLHQFPRGPAAPSMSPFPLKLETFLRMTKIQHQSDFSMQWSSKGKMPWMEYNGVEVADSQFCIEFLKKELGVDLNKHLSPQEKAIARAFQKMVEEDLYWAGAAERWIYDTGFVKKIAPWWLIMSFQSTLRKELWGQGMGRHSQEEVYTIAEGDTLALATYLGEKKFLMGDQPCEEDCAIFGLLAQVRWHAPEGRLGTLMEEKYPNLGKYCERMKEMFWPDWEAHTTDWGKRKALK